MRRLGGGAGIIKAERFTNEAVNPYSLRWVKSPSALTMMIVYHAERRGGEGRKEGGTHNKRSTTGKYFGIGGRGGRRGGGERQVVTWCHRSFNRLVTSLRVFATLHSYPESLHSFWTVPLPLGRQTITCNVGDNT